MADQIPEKLHCYWRHLCKGAFEDISVTEIVADILGGIVMAYAVIRYKLGQQTELPELIVLAIGCAILPAAISFLIRFLLVIPRRLHKQLGEKNEELKQKLAVKHLFIRTARYGFGDKTRDATEIVRSNIKNGKLVVESGNHLCGDPYPGTGKILTIEYDVYTDGSVQQLKSLTAEGKIVELP